MPSDPAYVDYRNELNGSRISESARVGAIVVFGLNSGFILLDWWVQSDRFWNLLGVRLAWDAVMVGVYCALGCANPLRVMLIGLYLSGLGMLCVIGIAGGVTSAYWPGMMILFLGIPVMLPVSVSQASLAVGSLTAGFVGLPLFTQETYSAREILAPVFFVMGAAIECVASTVALERLRLTDFKQRREIENARDHLSEMDQIKARFTANIHHELRTPLTLTLAPLESLLAGQFGPVTEMQRSYLTTMHSNALRLLKLINDLLDLAKVESDRLEIRRRRTDLVDLMSTLINEAAPLAAQKAVDLSLESPSGPVEVCVDTDAVEKVLMNLLGNALKFTESGGRISVCVRRGPESGAELSVVDTGVGIERDQLDRIFDRFAQADSSATRRFEGTGIGLALAKELVDLHRGRIWAESSGLGHGTTIHVTLPFGEADVEVHDTIIQPDDRVDLRTSERPSGEIRSRSRGSLQQIELARTVTRAKSFALNGSTTLETVDPRRSTVVVCDDNEDMRRLLLDLLKQEFNVRLATNGKEGLELVRAVRPDVVVTDVMMPVMSGLELCKAIKSNPDTAGIPVLLVTSKAEREMKIAGLEDGADDYVTKPFHARELLARLRSFIRLAGLREELAKKNGELEKTLGELKLAETQMIHAERLAAVGELAAGIAHEINNPINFAKNAAQAMVVYVGECRELARGTRCSAEANACKKFNEEGFEEALAAVEELVQIVGDGLARTGKLVGDLRDFAAPRRGANGNVDITRVLESALQLTAHAFEKAEIVVEFCAEPDLPLIWGDSGALGQVVLNLLKNAAEALEGNGGRVQVAVRRDRGGVEIRVSDDGPGVLQDIHEQLFEPFFTTKSAGQGTGLGLSICRQVVAEHRGEIWVQSEIGSGAEFVVWLPAQDRSVS